MSTRKQLSHDLDKLSDMLPIWLEKLRHPAAFWPQFDALSQAILDDAGEQDLEYVESRLQRMLQQHHLHRPFVHGLRISTRIEKSNRGFH